MTYGMVSRADLIQYLHGIKTYLASMAVEAGRDHDDLVREGLAGASRALDR